MQSGLILQTLCMHTFCEPVTLGLSGGALLGALLGNAFVGALMQGVLLIMVPRRHVLIVGVTLGSMLTSCALIVLTAQHRGFETFHWLFGALNNSWSSAIALGVTACVNYLVSLRFCPQLDLLLLGADHARALGLKTKRLFVLLMLKESLVVAVTVSQGGLIGSLGLVVPVVARRLSGTYLHRVNFHYGALLGSGALLVADFGAHTLLRPEVIPVGIMLNLLLAPFLCLNHAWK